jgi:diguanylate cyclase (GGDEF)-like protein
VSDQHDAPSLPRVRYADDIEDESTTGLEERTLIGRTQPDAGLVPCLIVVSGARAVGRVLPLRGSPLTLGRALSADVQLPEHSVSRRHAELIVMGERLLVRDLGSTNGTYHRGERVETVLLGEGERLQLGNVSLALLLMDDVEAATAEPIDPGPPGGLAGRSALRHALSESFEYARSQGSTVAVVLLAVGGLRRVEDEHGRGAARDLLAQIARVVRDLVPDEDSTAALYGWEEIALVLPDTALEDGCLCAESIRRAVERRHFVVGALELRATVSAGVAAYPEDAAATGPEALLETAERALHHAIAAGRNRVEPRASMRDRAPERPSR